MPDYMVCCTYPRLHHMFGTGIHNRLLITSSFAATWAGRGIGLALFCNCASFNVIPRQACVQSNTGNNGHDQHKITT